MFQTNVATTTTATTTATITTTLRIAGAKCASISCLCLYVCVYLCVSLFMCAYLCFVRIESVHLIEWSDALLMCADDSLYMLSFYSGWGGGGRGSKRRG